MDSKIGLDLSCSLPHPASDVIRLGHGSGGRMTSDLIEKIFLPAIGNEHLQDADDAAVVKAGAQRLLLTTDSFVVKPIFFPGGDIGSLSVFGTVNDLAVRGARPLALCASFILEEGFPLSDLQRILGSMQEACRRAVVSLIACDTKVVNRGSGDGVFITTTGLGLPLVADLPAADKAQPGDIVIISGELGLLGMAVMCARENLELDLTLCSDSAPLLDLVAAMLEATDEIHCMRDITRGGLATVCNELAERSNCGIVLEENAIPVNGQVKAACELLGLDPLYVACEGRLVAIVAPEVADRILEAMQAHPDGTGAAIIGKVTSEHARQVILHSRIGGRRIVDKLAGDQLPRIC